MLLAPAQAVVHRACAEQKCGHISWKTQRSYRAHHVLEDCGRTAPFRSEMIPGVRRCHEPCAREFAQPGGGHKARAGQHATEGGTETRGTGGRSKGRTCSSFSGQGRSARTHAPNLHFHTVIPVPDSLQHQPTDLANNCYLRRLKASSRDESDELHNVCRFRTCQEYSA